MTYFNTISRHYEQTKSSIAWFSSITLRKPTIGIDPTHCACAHHMLIRPIQVEVTVLVFRSDPIPESEMSNRLTNSIDFELLIYTKDFEILPKRRAFWNWNCLLLEFPFTFSVYFACKTGCFAYSGMFKHWQDMHSVYMGCTLQRSM